MLKEFRRDTDVHRLVGPRQAGRRTHLIINLVPCLYRALPRYFHQGFVYVHAVHTKAQFRPNATLRSRSASDVHHFVLGVGTVPFGKNSQNRVANRAKVQKLLGTDAFLRIVSNKFLMRRVVPGCRLLVFQVAPQVSSATVVSVPEFNVSRVSLLSLNVCSGFRSILPAMDSSVLAQLPRMKVQGDAAINDLSFAVSPVT